MTAGVQRELAEALDGMGCLDMAEEDDRNVVAAALLPTVQALIAEEGKRAAAGALRRMARWTVDTGHADAAVLREFRDRAAALDPSGAAEGAGR